MKKILLFTVLLTNTILFAQDEDAKKDGSWKTTGKITLLMNQSAFSNWQPGGDNAFSGNANFNYDFNYSKNGWVFDNKLIATIGISAVAGEDTKKTDDRLELNSILGKQITKYWNVSFFNNFKTQFLNGNNFSSDYTGTGNNKDFPVSGFFKPAYLSFGPGFFWKKSDNLSVNLAPVTSKFTFLSGEIFTLIDGDFISSNEMETYGVDPGENMRYEFGMNLRGYYRINLMENISMENILTLFSDYISKPQNVDIDYTMNLIMKINDVFSTNLTFQGVYDDNAYQGFQVKETFGIGISYIF
ncbi:DUF3078 domain-containing protein [Flavicella sp.]|uniref:DUF3078 domain-containing protein n=1 Tax=Flavicella sp. TaxID=2957742 RepID=UPI0030179381